MTLWSGNRVSMAFRNGLIVFTQINELSALDRRRTPQRQNQASTDLDSPLGDQITFVHNDYPLGDQGGVAFERRTGSIARRVGT